MITLFHTNDFHSRLTPEQVGFLKSVRSRLGTAGLIVDAGDAIASGNISYRSSGEPMLDLMNTIGYDLMTVGNREFHLTKRGFRSKLKRARFPVLCANVRVRSELLELDCPYWLMEALDPEDCLNIWGNMRPVADKSNPADAMDQAGRTRPVVDYAIRTVYDRGAGIGGPHGYRIAFFGITVPMITGAMLERHLSFYIFEEAIDVARRIVPLLKGRYNPDLIVALTHIGIDQDRRLAQSVEGIDLIIGGHSHTVLTEGERSGDALIVQAGSHGRFLGRVDVDLTSTVVSSEESQATLRPLMRASLVPMNPCPSKDEAEAVLQSIA